MYNYALEINGLTKSFPEFTLNDISFSLPKGFIMGLVGKNGSGKTTTIKLILELLQKENGSIKIFGDELQKSGDLKQDIAVVFDDLFFVDEWRISDVESAIAPFYIRWDTVDFHNYLKKFDLLRNKKIKELSKGMKIKLMLAVALSHKARLLILDEPTSGLDPVARDELLDILLQYMENENNCILFSTHITSDLDKIADYLTIMNDGSVFYTGTKDELFEKYCLVKGGLEELTTDIEKHLIGIQKGTMGFTALLDVRNMKYITSGMLTEKADIDDILIHINREQ